MSIEPLLEKEFSIWPLNSKWPPFFVKNVIFDNSNISGWIWFKFYMMMPRDNGALLKKRFPRWLLNFKMAAIFRKKRNL